MAEIKSPEERFCPECGNEHDLYYSQSFELPAGTYLCDGRYLVGRSLGSGGFGITYIGFDVKINKKIVIKETFYSGIFQRNNQNKTLSEPLKVTYDSSISLSEIMNKTQKECFCLSKAESFNNIVKVYDWFTENNTAYIITEFINGDTLYNRVMTNGRYEWKELYAKFKPLMQSLSQLHKANLLHRDIKPLNIMIRNVYRSREDFVLIDFGLARSNQAKTVASVGIAFSPGYSPFEQRTFTKNDGTYTDVYALAATMYFALTGEKPNDDIAADVYDNFPLLNEFRYSGTVPSNVVSAFESALQPDYRKRCQTIDDFLYMLDGAENTVYETPVESPYNRTSDYNSQERNNSQNSLQSSTQYAGSQAVFNSPQYPVQSPPARQNIGYSVQPQSPSTQNRSNKSKRILVNTLIVLCILLIGTGAILGLNTVGLIDIEGLIDNVITRDADNGSAESTSSGKITVPDIRNLELSKAQEILEREGLSWKITYQPTNQVVTQFPLSGELLKEGDTVSIYVAQPLEEVSSQAQSENQPQNVVVPNVVRAYYSDAADTLIAEGFEISWKECYSDTVVTDNIAKQEPVAGTTVEYGSTVTIYVSKGYDPAQYVQLGDYKGQNITDVKKDLEAKGLKVTYSKDTKSSLPENTIISQSIEPGIYCKKGTTVKFVVSKPEAQSTASTASTVSQNQTNSQNNQNITHSSPVFHHVTSSSYLAPQGSYTYTEKNILRNNGSCWCEGVDGSGVGEYVMFYDENTQYVSACSIINGYNHDSETFNKNGRLTKVTFEFSNGKQFTFDVDPNTMNEQTFYFGEAIATTSLKIIIADAQDGTEFQDTCISLIVPK